MTKEEYAHRLELIRNKLYKTALLYLGNESLAIDALDEAIYKGLCKRKQLRQIELFDTWMTRIVINECYNELRRLRRFQILDELPDTAIEEYDSLPLKEAIRRLPKDLKDVIILHYFSGYTLDETADALQVPTGTVSTRQRKALRLLKLELSEEVSE